MLRSVAGLAGQACLGATASPGGIIAVRWAQESWGASASGVAMAPVARHRLGNSSALPRVVTCLCAPLDLLRALNFCGVLGDALRLER